MESGGLRGGGAGHGFHGRLRRQRGEESGRRAAGQTDAADQRKIIIMMLQEFKLHSWSLPRVLARCKQRRQYWGQHMWARGYFCCSTGNVTDEIIKNYIEQQDAEDDIFRVEGEL